MPKKKLLRLDSSEDEPETQDKPENILASDSTQLIPNEIKFLNDGIYIDSNGLKINNKHYKLNFKSDIVKIKSIGVGSSAKVQKVHLKTNPNIFYAMKTISIYDKGNRVQLINDLKNYITSQGDCPFLLKFYGCYLEGGNVSLILEYMENGSLKNLIDSYKEQNKIISESLIKKIIEQTLHGLAFIHSVTHQIHLDIKPENILLNLNNDIKISDFGIARILDFTNANAQTFVGTMHYMSPERLASKPYTTTADIWSLGMILLEFITLEYPFKGCRNILELIGEFTEERIAARLREVEGRYSKNLMTFLKICLRIDPNKRPFAIDLISHKWFFE